MNKTLTVARLSFKLLLRQGSLKGLPLIIIALCAFSFFSASDDSGILIDELKLKTLYSFSISYTFLSVAVIALTCFTIRRQIDSRNIYQLCSLPLSRFNIWLGQALALFAASLLLLVCLYSTLIASIYIFQKSFPLEERNALSKSISSPEKQVKPIFLSDYDLIIKTVQEKGGKLQAGMPPEIWDAIHLEVIREAQTLETQESKTYEFDLGQRPSTEFFTFHFRPFFLGENADFKFELLPDLNAPPNYSMMDKTTQARKTFLQMPSSAIPSDGRIFIKITNLHSGSVNIQRNSGIYCSFTSSTVNLNLIKAFSSHSLHLAIFVILGMTCATALTFATASFASFSLFLLSLSYGFFQGIAKDMLFMYEPPFSKIFASKTIESLLWIVKGLQAPPVIENFSQSRLIENYNVFGLWLPSALVYGLIISALGVYLFNKKELSLLEV